MDKKDVIANSGFEISDKDCLHITNNYAIKYNPILVLRGIKLASQLDINIDSQTWIQMCINSHQLSSSNKFLVRQELDGILLTDKPSKAIRRLFYCGALHQILPELTNLKDLTQEHCHFEDAFDHSLSVLDKTQPYIPNRLAALLHDIGKFGSKITNIINTKFPRHENNGAVIATAIMERIGYPEDIIEKVVIAIKNHTRFQQTNFPSGKSIKKFLDNVGAANVDLCLDIIEANNSSRKLAYCINNQTAKIKEQINLLVNANGKKGENVKLPLNGNDIMKAFNLKKGPLVGHCLRCLKEYMLIMPKMTKEEALILIQEQIRKET